MKANHTRLWDKKRTTEKLDTGLLQSEIEFWRSLIQSLDADARQGEMAERMHQALALAQFRLESTLMKTARLSIV